MKLPALFSKPALPGLPSLNAPSFRLKEESQREAKKENALPSLSAPPVADVFARSSAASFPSLTSPLPVAAAQGDVLILAPVEEDGRESAPPAKTPDAARAKTPAKSVFAANPFDQAPKPAADAVDALWAWQRPLVSDKPISLSALEKRDLFFSEQALRVRLDKFIASLFSADIAAEHSLDDAAPELLLSFEPTRWGQAHQVLSIAPQASRKIKLSPSTALDGGASRKDAANYNPFQVLSAAAPALTEDEAEEQGEPALIGPLRVQRLSVRPRPELPEALEIFASHDHRLAKSPLQPQRYAWDPETQEVYTAEFFALNGIERRQSGWVKSSLSALQTAGERLVRVLPFLSAIPLRVKTLADDTQALSLGETVQYAPATRTADFQGKPVRIFTLIRQPDGNLAEVLDVSESPLPVSLDGDIDLQKRSADSAGESQKRSPDGDAEPQKRLKEALSLLVSQQEAQGLVLA